MQSNDIELCEQFDLKLKEKISNIYSFICQEIVFPLKTLSEVTVRNFGKYIMFEISLFYSARQINPWWNHIYFMESFYRWSVYRLDVRTSINSHGARL